MPDASGSSGATIAAIAAPAAGSLINSIGGVFGNRANRRFSERMYNQQRSDNLAFWNQQNEYNSPAAQMARFKAAGLNPHLIYGQGSAGNASSVQTPDVQPLNRRDPEFGNVLSTAGNSMLNYYDIKIKQAQANNLAADLTVKMQDAALRAAQVKATRTNEERVRFELEYRSEFRNLSADALREGVRSTQVRTDIALNEDARRAALTASSLREAAERLISIRVSRGKDVAETARIRKSISLMEKDGRLKDIEINLRKNGINPNDPAWARVVGQLLSNMLDVDVSSSSGVKSALSRGADAVSNFFLHPFPH